MHLLSPKGFVAGAVHAGIKSSKKNDVGLLICDAPPLASAAAVFTTNKVFAAPVKIGREHLCASGGRLRGVVVNSGNANACTGAQGDRDARRMCSLAAKTISCEPKQILPCSTGIIGHLMPMQKIERGIIRAAAQLGRSEDHALAFADAILTTDTRRKSAAERVKIDRETITIAGVCKGSGMIGPRMSLDVSPHATMLAYVTTDAEISVPLLRKLLAAATDRSFNAVTVDDHTSTNDTAVILASGLSGATVLSARQIAAFGAALDEVCQSLAYQIAADGEGATKVVRIEVQGARSTSDANKIARAIANSPLVKCAMHGNDPNWGRIVSAAGLCGAEFDPDRATLTLQGTRVFHRGRPVSFDPAKVSRALNSKEVVVDLRCNLAKSDATVWTCDLSKDYVTINADYHT
ncbi:bifunctional glutamate N-acetyltransferase/amino-acid acetyltransferase ArgJ [soil metagenome]